MSIGKEHYENLANAYQKNLEMNERDNIFYDRINNSYSEHRKAHCCMMDILNRDFTTVDAITWKALEELQIMPECQSEQELHDFVFEIKDKMLEFCNDFGIEIDAMNTMSVNDIMDIRNCVRDMVIEKSRDSISAYVKDEQEYDEQEYEDWTQSR